MIFFLLIVNSVKMDKKMRKEKQRIREAEKMVSHNISSDLD